MESLGGDPVGKLAQVYEVARNALEYRAEHLVRRAAIERILKRHMLFETDAERLTEKLLQELKWAKYVGGSEKEAGIIGEITTTLAGYLKALKSVRVERDWLVGVASAEVEEKLNPNTDYHVFTGFAYAVLKKQVVLAEGKNADLLLFVAVDKTYSQSDDQQIAYHLLKSIRKEMAKHDKEFSDDSAIEEAYKYFKTANSEPALNTISVFVRKQMGPLVLIRDMYFAAPEKFAQVMAEESEFKNEARQVLSAQLKLLQSRMNTASKRSLIYVFSTKMLFGLLLEIPVERWLRGQVEYLALAVNTLFPVFAMWLLTANIRLPDQQAQDKIVSTAWRIVDTDLETLEKFKPRGTTPPSIKETIFYGIYFALFMMIFAFIFWVLNKLGFSVIGMTIFIFFLSVVSFFAFRIRQTALSYSYKPSARWTSTVSEMLLLPIVVVGGYLSRGVSKLNFLVFVFDFVLEAPFKVILRVMDSWFQFLSAKKDEVVG